MTSKADLKRSSVYVRLALAEVHVSGIRLSYEDVLELLIHGPTTNIGDRAIRDAARAGYAIDDMEGLIKAPPGYAEGVLEDWSKA